MASFCFWGVARQRLSTPNLLIICVRTCAHTYTPPHSPHTYIHAHIYTQAIHPFHLSCYVAQLPWPRTHYFSCFSWVLGFIVCTVMPSLQIFLLNFCNYTMKVDATLICIIGKTWMMKKIQIVFFLSKIRGASIWNFNLSNSGIYVYILSIKLDMLNLNSLKNLVFRLGILNLYFVIELLRRDCWFPNNDTDLLFMKTWPIA